MTRQELGTELKIARAKLGLNQNEYAKQIGVGITILSLIEKGVNRQYAVATLVRIAKALNLDVKEVLSIQQ